MELRQIQREPPYDGHIFCSVSRWLRFNPGGGYAIDLSFSPVFIDMTAVYLSARQLLSFSGAHQENVSDQRVPY